MLQSAMSAGPRQQQVHFAQQVQQQAAAVESGASHRESDAQGSVDLHSHTPPPPSPPRPANLSMCQSSPSPHALLAQHAQQHSAAGSSPMLPLPPFHSVEVGTHPCSMGMASWAQHAQQGGGTITGWNEAGRGAGAPAQPDAPGSSVTGPRAGRPIPSGRHLSAQVGRRGAGCACAWGDVHSSMVDVCAHG